jgi:hypothetical protein
MKSRSRSQICPVRASSRVQKPDNPISKHIGRFADVKQAMSASSASSNAKVSFLGKLVCWWALGGSSHSKDLAAVPAGS